MGFLLTILGYFMTGIILLCVFTFIAMAIFFAAWELFDIAKFILNGLAWIAKGIVKVIRWIFK